MGKEPHQPDEWWMDDCTRSTVEEELGIGDTLTFTVYEEHPLSLSRSQVLSREALYIIVNCDSRLPAQSPPYSF